MRTLSAALNAVYGGIVTRPAWLVRIGLDPVLRLSSFDDVYFDSAWWTRFDVDVSGVRIEPAKVAGRIKLGNADDLIGAMVLAQGISDVPVSIYGYDAAATATADFVLLAEAVGAGTKINEQAVEISLRDSTEFLYSPRVTVTKANGFYQLLPAGTVLTINDQTYRIERNR